MKEFVEKLIGRLETKKENEKSKECYEFGNLGIANVKGFNRGLVTAISIINQLAEEYLANTKQNFAGWIPCEERYPDTTEYILLSFTNFSVPVVGI